jgi:hypothetical protein
MNEAVSAGPLYQPATAAPVFRGRYLSINYKPGRRHQVWFVLRDGGLWWRPMPHPKVKRIRHHPQVSGGLPAGVGCAAAGVGRGGVPAKVGRGQAAHRGQYRFDMSSSGRSVHQARLHLGRRGPVAIWASRQ